MLAFCKSTSYYKDRNTNNYVSKSTIICDQNMTFCDPAKTLHVNQLLSDADIIGTEWPKGYVKLFILIPSDL